MSFMALESLQTSLWASAKVMVLSTEGSSPSQMMAVSLAFSGR